MKKLISLCIHFSFLFYTRVQPINNVVIISGAQQSDSALHIHVSILLQIPLSSRLPYYIGRVPCAIQYVFVGYPF